RAASTPAEQIQDALQLQHANGTHVPGTDAGCLNCQTACFCNTGFECVRCALEHQADPDTFTDCQVCGAPGGYPYCTGSFSGQPSCADVVRPDITGPASHDLEVGDDGRAQCPSCGRRAPMIGDRLAVHLKHPGMPADTCDGGDPTLRGW
ncbi:hypothetical protein, partial [Actinoplanes awajinensis]|uniref:hypothetical protein n=1 Tax=Actinoplanes awajinensis TaxID=135946 RepID=UPI000A479B57